MNKKYLIRALEPEAQAAAKLLAGQKFSHFVAIPACGEHQLLPASLNALAAACGDRQVLLALTINENSQAPADYRTSNGKTLAWLRSHYQLSKFETGAATGRSNGLTIVVTDRTGTKAFPRDQGVGLARKIGNDIGALLYDDGLLSSPWLHNTDADAAVPPDYFEQTQPYAASGQPPAALLYRYRHHNENSETTEEHWSAALRYEIWLRYYVLGLRFAGSTYAFPTIGSTICSHARFYSQAHGFPKKSAGEDFYLLNKLHKLSPVQSLQGSPIKLTDRNSVRVPFGTGQGSRKIAETLAAGKDYLVYDPQCFSALRTFLAAVSQSLNRNISSWQDYPATATENRYLQLISGYLGADQISEQIRRAEQRASSRLPAPAQFEQWFDAFAQLKTIHYLRDHGLPSLPLASALQRAVFLPDLPEGSLAVQLEYLRQREEHS